ncbi:MAG TPA: VCBS repeat-containing protein, partial [Planctomycetota bacterium]|nr:VCBS repeat-containing protein [Planctomycetota bacterium]
MPSTSVPPRGHARALPPLAIACLLLAGSASAQLAFQSTTLFPNGASRVADVNGDGFPDLFVVSFAAPAVYPGLEGGVFGPIVGSSGPLVSQSYVLGDLDADGRADLVHPHSPPSAALDVRLATLNAVFLPARIVPLPHVPATTYLVDVTGDGAIDLVALPADPGVGRLMLVPGHGDGTFDAALELPASGLLDGHPLSFGDLNGDQLTDIVLNATPGGTKPAPGITALLSHGDGHFAPPITLTTAPHATLSAGDVLGLGRDSVLSADVDGVRVLTLAPHGGSAEILIPAPGVNPADTLLAGQVVAGGPLEIVVATGAHAVLVNDGSGHFTSAPPVVIPGELLLIADADHDGAADLVGSTGIARGQGDGSFEPWYGLPGFTRGLAAADVDGDGHPDVITTFAEVAPAQIRHGRLDGSLGPPSILDVGPSPLDVRLLDVAGSAHVDALTLNVVPSSESGPSVLAVCAGHDDGSFAPPVLTPVGDAQGMDVADFDDDGLPDVLLWPETLVLRNAGGGSWLASSVPASLAVLAACAGDFNGDGHVDILRLLKQPANIVLRQVLLGHGDGTFEPLAIESSGAFGSISALSGVQLDADGQLDLVVTLHQGQWLAQSSGFIVAFPG